MQARELAKSRRKNAWRVCGFDLCVKIIEFKRQQHTIHTRILILIMLGESVIRTFYLSAIHMLSRYLLLRLPLDHATQGFRLKIFDKEASRKNPTLLGWKP